MPRAAALALLLASATACANDVPEADWSSGLLPKGVTEQGNVVESLWNGAWIAALATGAVVLALILWACVFHRKRNKSAELPPQVRYNLPIEIFYTLVPLVMVSVFFFYTARDSNTLEKVSATPDVKVKVEAFQWSWRFTTEVGGKKLTPVVGQPVSDYRQGPQLVLPVGKTVQFDLSSPDVIHSFWVPAFRFKRDVIPGIKEGNPGRVFEVKTLNEPGVYAGRCAELCGVDHSRMLFSVKLVAQDEYDKYLAQAGSTQ
ncbi:aa3-type cytochrome oxidase subunit II [Nonomuraea endophytica]|uniref:cytochrome-c oxidase n=1 Tax=Nonomuraea endophytica TaxID=714136 RepID=A0A7W8ACA1_9ACTN|nr:cytochrome c oxidase subunit II [Nonomuraea endophytica]MBB5082550.1 cytochrome c oxidase subunit 2 [Nonomuraea endophytica]